MFSSFGQSWEVIRQSYAVLKRQKTLALFPMLSGVACLFVMATFVAPFLVSPELAKSYFSEVEGERNELGWREVILFAIAFAFYFVNYFIIVFFNTALVSCAIVHFKGGNPTLGDGLAAAGRRLPQIAGWALLAATVGMILNAIEQRSQRVGQFVVGLLGLAWSAAVYLIVPILAVEGLGPIGALKRSVSLLRKTWGTSLAGALSLGLAGFLVSLPGIALMMGAVALSQYGVWVLVPGLVLGFLYLVTVAIVLSTLKQIFLAGLYVYAAEDRIPAGFSQDAIAGAFRTKT